MEKNKKVRQGVVPYEASKFEIGFDAPGDMGYAHVIAENIDKLFEEIDEYDYSLTKKDLYDIKDYSDVDLSSFKPQYELNPKIWANKFINSKVRLRLLDIADDFIEFLNVDWAKYKDIILTGSLCSYNYSKFSDFDLHILYDFKDIDERTDFVKQYFDSKKSLWNEQHEDLKIYGYPVEVYVQDINEPHTANGMYSLDKNNWIKKPETNNVKAIKLDKFLIKEKIIKIVKKIEKLDICSQKETDEYKIRQLGQQVKKLFDYIKGLRKESLKKSGEMSSGNIIFKYLRRYGYMEKLMDLKYHLYDKMNSLS